MKSTNAWEVGYVGRVGGGWKDGGEDDEAEVVEHRAV